MKSFVGSVMLKLFVVGLALFARRFFGSDELEELEQSLGEVQNFRGMPKEDVARALSLSLRCRADTPK